MPSGSNGGGYGGGRERKTKPAKYKGRGEQSHDGDDSFEDAAFFQKGQRSPKKASKRDKYIKGFTSSTDEDDSSPKISGEGPGKDKGRRLLGAVNLYSVAENLFTQWEELLGSREGLKSRLDSIAAVSKKGS